MVILGLFRHFSRLISLLFLVEVKVFITVHRHVASDVTEVAFNSWTFAMRVAKLVTLSADWLLIVMTYPAPFVGYLQ